MWFSHRAVHPARHSLNGALSHCQSHKTLGQICAASATCLGLVAAFLTRPVSPALAQITSDSIQIEPAFQEISIADTQATASGSLTLKNFSQADHIFEVFAVDIKQFDQEGRVILADKPLSGANYSLANFVSLPQSEWLVAAGKSLTIPFSISNQPTLSPGGHYAGLVARLKAETGAAGEQRLLPAVSSFILVRKIGGELYHLSLGPLESAERFVWWSMPKALSLRFSNQGNIHVTPRGTVEFKDLFGRVTNLGIINEDSLLVLPSTQRQLTVSVRPVSWQWPVMLYSVKAEGRSEPGNVSFAQTSTFLIVQPIALGMAGLLVILVIVVGVLSRRFLQKRSRLRKRHEA